MLFCLYFSSKSKPCSSIHYSVSPLIRFKLQCLQNSSKYFLWNLNFKKSKIPKLYIQPLHWMVPLPSIIQIWFFPEVILLLQPSQEVIIFLFFWAWDKCLPWSLLPVPENCSFLLPKSLSPLRHILSDFTMHYFSLLQFSVFPIRRFHFWKISAPALLLGSSTTILLPFLVTQKSI